MSRGFDDFYGFSLRFYFFNKTYICLFPRVIHNFHSPVLVDKVDKSVNNFKIKVFLLFPPVDK